MIAGRSNLGGYCSDMGMDQVFYIHGMSYKGG